MSEGEPFYDMNDHEFRQGVVGIEQRHGRYA